MLRGVDLALPVGHSLALTGANGAGKTTLLRIIATLLKPTSGEGSVDGLSLREEPQRVRERTTYVSARGFVYDDLTAAENLRFAAKMADVQVVAERIEEILEGVGLGRAAHQVVRTYSTGMRRRLVLATLRLRPVYLALLDEPYAGLDTEGTRLVDRIVADLLDAGTTVVIASHQDGEATRRASRAMRLENGRLV